MDENVKIIVSAVDKASKDLQNIGKTGKSVTDMWKTAGKVIGAVAAVGATAKKAFDLGKEGAQLEYTAGKFDRLATSVGTFSELLLTDLRNATKGTRSDAELMAGASDLMSLGLAKSREEVVRLSRVVGGLGMDMNQLVLTLTNQTTMRFDALGVSVEGFQERVDKLKKSGMDANKAFTEAFLQQAEEQLAKVGDLADTNAGKIAQMEASVKNLADSFKLWLAPAVADAATALDDLLKGKTTPEKTREEFDKVKATIFETAGSYEEYAKEMIKAGVAARMLTDVALTYDLTLEAGRKHRDNNLAYIGALTEAQWEAARASAANVAGYQDAERRSRGWILGLDRAAQKTEKLTKNSDMLTNTLESTKKAELEQQRILDGYVSAAYRAEQEQKKFNERLELYHATLSGTMDRDQKNFNQNIEDLRLKTIDLKTRIGELEKKKYLSKDQKAELSDLREELENTGEQMTLMADAHDEATKRILINMMEQNLAANGLTKNELGLLEQLREKWGLVDKGTRDAAAAASEAAGIYQGALASGVQVATDRVNAFWDAWSALNSLGQIKDFKIRIATENAEYINAFGGETNPYAPKPKPKTADETSDYTFGGNKSGGGKGVQQHSSGGIIAPGEIGTVGERGWEYVEGLPGGGARVYSNAQSQRISAGGDTYNNINIYQLPGESGEALAAKVFAMISRANRRMSAGAGYAGA